MAEPAIVLLPAQFTVEIDGVRVEHQVTEATIGFDTSTTTVRTLTEETDYATGEKATLTLAAYADWTNEDQDASLCWTLWNNAGKRVPFEIEGEDQDGTKVTAAGVVQVRRPSFGPNATDAAQFSIDIPVIGIPDLTYIAGARGTAAPA